jgi:mannose-1-phosphate guanylyltransferase
MEKTSKLDIVPSNLKWQDVGTWKNIAESIRSTDSLGNSSSGEVILNKVRNSFIKGGKKPVAVIGLENIIIVDTEEALLVMNKDHCQEVKEISKAFSKKSLLKEL